MFVRHSITTFRDQSSNIIYRSFWRGVLPANAKGSFGEKLLYKILYPPQDQHWFPQKIGQVCRLLAGAPWYITWWNLTQYMRMFIYFGIQGRTFELDYRDVLQQTYHANGCIKGIIHIGASTGQEAHLYNEIGIPKIIWIEAQPELQKELENTIHQHRSKKGMDDCVFIAAVMDKEESATLYPVDNSISTSLKPLGPGHLRYFPFLNQLEPIPIQTTTLLRLFEKEQLDMTDYDMMYLDVQGSELDVLRGATDILPHIQHIMTEVSVSEHEHYVGGTCEKDLHDFLEGHGFHRVARAVPPNGHGNALYTKNKTFEM